eukprot:1389597-Prymnesium_polylepis.2
MSMSHVLNGSAMAHPWATAGSDSSQLATAPGATAYDCGARTPHCPTLGRTGPRDSGRPNASNE